MAGHSVFASFFLRTTYLNLERESTGEVVCSHYTLEPRLFNSYCVPVPAISMVWFVTVIALRAAEVIQKVQLGAGS